MSADALSDTRGRKKENENATANLDLTGLNRPVLTANFGRGRLLLLLPESMNGSPIASVARPSLRGGRLQFVADVFPHTRIRAGNELFESPVKDQLGLVVL